MWNSWSLKYWPCSFITIWCLEPILISILFHCHLIILSTFQNHLLSSRSKLCHETILFHLTVIKYLIVKRYDREDCISLWSEVHLIAAQIFFHNSCHWLILRKEWNRVPKYQKLDWPAVVGLLTDYWVGTYHREVEGSGCWLSSTSLKGQSDTSRFILRGIRGGRRLMKHPSRKKPRKKHNFCKYVFLWEF